MEAIKIREKLDKIRNSKAFGIAKKVLTGILYGILLAVMLMLLWLGFDKLVLKSTVPSIFGYATLTVETGSMASELQIGDMIIIKDTGDYKIGDIITYAHEGETVPTTHRIIGYDEDGFITRGDANNTEDRERVSEDIIFGEVIKVYPRVGLFSKWVSMEGWIYILAVLAIIARGVFVVKSQGETGSEVNNEKKENNENTEESSAEEADTEACEAKEENSENS